MMDALPNIIPKSIKVLNRLENDEDNRYSWKLVNAESGFIVINHQLQTSRKMTPNKAKDNSDVAGCTTVKPVRR